MTKSLTAVKVAPPLPLLNSILATAKTAHELDAAHRKTAKIKALRHSPNYQRPSLARHDDTVSCTS